MSSVLTYLFHDYETWGVNPSQDYPSQFAAIRTDANFNPIGKPINILNRIPNDYLPSPTACLVTGITPQKTLQEGLIEAEFAAQIFHHMSQPHTCSLGYNSIRFDDEVTRHLFYRNFYDPYAREWQNGNSRWDIIDLARACYALRPEGINWPIKEDGSPSFKLEHITAENGIEHSGAHDALADVYATIALTKLIKQAQPKLFDYGFSLRSKHNVWQQISLKKLTPLLHISSKVPATQGCCTYILPIAVHPTQANAVICIDLSKDPNLLMGKSSEEIKTALYATSNDLPDPNLRPGLKLVHVNKSPFITKAKAISLQRTHEIGLDRDKCLYHYRLLQNNTAIFDTLIQVFNDDQRDDNRDDNNDIEQTLYTGGFMTNEEKKLCDQIREAQVEQLARLQTSSSSPRISRLLFRYRARNFPQTLTHEEVTKWQRHRQSRLQDGISSINLQNFFHECESLAQKYENNQQKMNLLSNLIKYAESL